jgi:hypothetical protein
MNGLGQQSSAHLYLMHTWIAFQLQVRYAITLFVDKSFNTFLFNSQEN